LCFAILIFANLSGALEEGHFAKRVLIAVLFGYRLWSAEFLPPLVQQAAQIVRRDVTPGFIVAELIAYLNEHKIIRPGYMLNHAPFFFYCLASNQASASLFCA